MTNQLNLSDEESAAKHLTKRHVGAIGGVFLSRALGVIRTIIVNSYFGANTALDAFNTAFRFPNSLRDLFADGALSAAFTKALVDIKPEGLQKERELISVVTGFFLVVTLLLSILGVLFALPFMELISDPRFQQSGGLLLASDLFKLLIFYLPLTMLNAIVMAILGISGLTFRAMNGSLFVSVGMVGGTLLLSPLFSSAIYGLAYGALIGAILQLIYQAIPLFSMQLITWPNINPVTWIQFKPLRQILKMIAPRAIGQGAATMALMVNTYFALKVGAGAMTFVATTIIIIQVPIGLFGVATGFASLPLLTEAINQREFKRFSNLLTQSLDTSLWLSLFTTLGFSLLIVPLYIVLFQHGKITFADTIQNAICICAYASGILFAAGSKMLLNSLYALNASKQVVYNSIIYLFVNAFLSALLVPTYGLIGLGFAFGIASAVNYWLNYGFVYFAFKQLYPADSPFMSGGPHYWLKNMLYTLAAFVLSLFGVYFTTHGWPVFTEITQVSLTLIGAIEILLIAGLALILLFMGLTYYIGPESLKVLLKRRQRK